MRVPYLSNRMLEEHLKNNTLKCRNADGNSTKSPSNWPRESLHTLMWQPPFQCLRITLLLTMSTPSSKHWHQTPILPLPFHSGPNAPMISGQKWEIGEMCFPQARCVQVVHHGSSLSMQFAGDSAVSKSYTTLPYTVCLEKITSKILHPQLLRFPLLISQDYLE